ncbi:MAG: amidohydrolase family protein [Pseudomonadota bacterium]
MRVPAGITDIVDAHHHIWDLEKVRYPWLMQRGVKRFFGDPSPIQHTYEINDLRREFGELPVNRSVHIQVGAADDQTVAETAWVQSQSDAYDQPNALVVFVDLAADNADAMLDTQQAYSGVRGVRQIIGRHVSEDSQTGTGSLIDNPTFERNLKQLSARGLSFDLQLIPPQMPALLSLLDRCPDTPIALCHCGSPWDQTDAGLRFWREQIVAFAKREHIVCKVSGLGMFNPAWDAASARQIVLPIIDAFGPDRVMFGSNYPVDKLYRPYVDIYRDYFTLTADFELHEQQRMFCDTAARFYRL